MPNYPEIPKPAYYQEYAEKPALKKRPTVRINTAPQYQDVWASVLFWITALAYFATCIFGMTRVKFEQASSNQAQTVAISAIALVAIVFGFLLSFLFMCCLKKCAGKMIKMTIVLNLIAMTALTALAFVLKSYIVGGVLAGILVLKLVYYFFAWKRIPLSKFLLKTVIPIIQEYRATLTAAFVGILVQVVVLAFLFFGMAAFTSSSLNISSGGFSFKTANSIQDQNLSIGLICFCAFAVFWIFQVVKNVVHVTVSGLFATYYFMGISTGQSVSVPVRNPTAAAAKRALTSSFGSICFGSLIIVFISILKSLMRQASESNRANSANSSSVAILLCCLSCFLGFLENVINYFNYYAFTQVAIYGKSFCTASKDTWKLMKSSGVDVIINDNLIDFVFFFFSLVMSFVASILTTLIACIFRAHFREDSMISAGGFIGFLVCFCIISTYCTIISSAVSCTLVCLVEDPEALQKTKPELYDKIRKTYPNILI